MHIVNRDKGHSVTILAREGTVKSPRLRPIEVIQGLTRQQAKRTALAHQVDNSAFGRSIYAYIVR